MTKKTVLFSGRFDPPHLGHVKSIVFLAKKYGAVKVVMLDYPERRFPVVYCEKIFNDVFGEMSLDIDLVVNSVHFGKITEENIKEFKADLFVSVNLKVLRHVESLGMKCDYIDFSYQYRASEYAFPK